MPSNYERVNQTFEKAVVQLQENLQFLADQDKVSDKFISMQNFIIKALIDYQQETEQLIGKLEWDVFELANKKLKEVDELKDIKTSYEAICIIHGIMDFPAWMSKGKSLLVNQAVEDYKESITTLPSALKDKFEQLPINEGTELDKILYKDYYKRIAELDEQIKNFKNQNR